MIIANMRDFPEQANAGVNNWTGDLIKKSCAYTHVIEMYVPVRAGDVN